MSRLSNAPTNTVFRTVAKRAFTVAGIAATLMVAPKAHAQRELLTHPGERHTLVVDQISGFRASLGGGLSFYGPIGFTSQKTTVPALNSAVTRETVITTNTLYVAPSADYFVVDHLSIGGIFQIASTSGSQEVRLTTGSSVTSDVPTVTNLSLVPRVGYMFAPSDRWGIWPRLGFGYTSNASVSGSGNDATTTKFSGPILNLDVGVLYRFNEALFFRLAPDLAFGVGNSLSISRSGTSLSASSEYLHFGLNAGIGGMFHL